MSTWAYVCRSCAGDRSASWYASAAMVAEMPPHVRIIRVKVGADWHCAVVDREHPVAVEQLVVRDAIASSEDDCPDCVARAVRPVLLTQAKLQSGGVPRATGEPADAAPAETPMAAAAAAPHGATRQVQAAAISLQGQRLVVVLVALDLLQGGGEADLAIETLAPSFGGVPLVLLAQRDDGSPCWYGPAELLRLLEGIPLERMPWKTYPVR